jgi:hypothetical protein
MPIQMRVYHKREARRPDTHTSAAGDWYYRPTCAFAGARFFWSDTGDAYSVGYPSREAAQAAGDAWAKVLSSLDAWRLVGE